MGKLESKDPAAAASEKDGFAEAKSLDDGADIAGLLGGIEFLGDFDAAGRHLAAVESGTGESVGERGDHVVELSAMAVTAGNEGDQGATALVPVVQVTAFVVHGCSGRVEFHSDGFLVLN